LANKGTYTFLALYLLTNGSTALADRPFAAGLKSNTIAVDSVDYKAAAAWDTGFEERF